MARKFCWLIVRIFFGMTEKKRSKRLESQNLPVVFVKYIISNAKCYTMLYMLE